MTYLTNYFFYKVIKESYTPYYIILKLKYVLFLRILKFSGIIINQKFGYIFLKWNGKENKILDKVGSNVEKLFLKLYNKQIDDKDIYIFIIII